MTKLLSICIVTLNDHENLVKTLESLEYSDRIEIILQDGGSNYDINQTLEKFEKLKPIIVLKIEKDLGIYDAMNKAVARSSGRFLMFLNCGDCIASGRMSALLHVISKIEPHFLCIKFLANVAGEGIKVERASPLYFARRMLNHQSIIYRKEAFKTVRFDHKMKIAGDLRHFLEARLTRSVAYVDLVLIEYMNGGAAAVRSGIRQNWLERSSSWKWHVGIKQRLILMIVVLLRYMLYVTRIKN